MKKRNFFCFMLLFACCFFQQKGLCQNQGLEVTQLVSFPDSANEGQGYNFDIVITNTDFQNAFLTDSVRIILKTDSVSLPEDTLITFYIDSLAALDTVDVPVINFKFTSAHYKAGSNIIVVWPRVSNGVAPPIDSLHGTLFFNPLTSVHHFKEPLFAFSLYPNPATDELWLKADIGNGVEYVRILNDIGQQVYYDESINKLLNIGFLSEGFYFIELKRSDGMLVRKKFLKL